MILDKPTEPRVAPVASFCYDIAERVTRALQDSELSVARATVLSSVPEAIKDPGRPPAHWERASIMIECTFVTDRTRGWLILVDDQIEWDAEVELTELFSQILGGGSPGRDFVVRAADRVGESPTTVLDLVRDEGLRERIEREYERAFAGAAPIDHQVLVDRCRTNGYGFQAEPQIREDCAEWDAHEARRPARPREAPAPSEARGPNRAERRAARTRARRRPRARRRR